MQVPRHRSIRIGTPVSIVLKADQRTGRQVQGVVAQVLTRGDHPRGVKVRLADGRIGRVQQLSSDSFQAPTIASFPRRSNMDPEQNPWQSSASQGNPYLNQQGGNQPPGQYNQQSGQGENAQYYGNTYNQGQNYNNNRPQEPPPQPTRQRSDSDNLLAQQSDRAEQLEYMQNYEAHAKQTIHDKNQEQLQKEFPNVDSSLIAALYSDTKDLSATREMLQELART